MKSYRTRPTIAVTWSTPAPSLSITRGALSLNLGGQADVASGGDSHGYSGSLSVGYAF